MKWTYCLFLLFFACNVVTEEPASTVTTEPTTIVSPPKQTNKLPKISELTLTVDNLKLREQPGSDGKELMRLPEKSVVMPTGEMTDLKQQVSLRGLSYNEPWLEVKVNDNIKGWIFGGAADLDPEASEFSKTLFNIRHGRFFGREGDALNNYSNSFKNAKSAADVKSVFENGRGLQDLVTKAFAKKCRVAEMPMDISLGWINKSYPGFTLARVAEATELAFLPNLNDFIELAAKTPEQDDDKAFAFLKALNGNYSILLFFRDWFNQTTDYGGVSLLGIGKHFEYLSQAEALKQEGNIFADGFIQEECNFMVDDIVKNSSGYSRDKTSILAEIDKIIAANFSILDENQKLAIAERKKAFENPEVNKIRVNEKVGN